MPVVGSVSDLAVTPSPGAVNLLVFGSDSRISAGDPTQWVAGAQRTDAIMLVHIPEDRSHVYVVSIPRDSWVDVPGHGKAKINAAFSWGGPTLAIRTVERLTKVRIDHMVLTDFTGFASLTDMLGGVDIDVAKTTHGDTHGIGTNFTAGTHHMDGATALTYVRQRYVLPAGDFDRVKRQQNWIRSVFRTAASSGVQKDPAKMYALLDTMASSLSTDSQFTMDKMRGLAFSLRGIRSGGVSFLTVPLVGTDTSADGQSIVRLDSTAGGQLWKAVRQDHVGQWLSASGYATLGATVS
jgi:LCP family protein required for cell wall assembly